MPQNRDNTATQHHNNTPPKKTGVEVVIPGGVMDRILALRGKTPAKLPTDTSGGYRAKVDMAGYFFL